MIRLIVLSLCLLSTFARFSAVAQDSFYPDTFPPAETAQERQDDLSLEALEEMLPAHLRSPLPIKGDAAQNPAPSIETESSAVLDTALESPEPASATENFYRAATGDSSLRQFGYDYFMRGDGQTKSALSGGVQDDYVLGAGDRVTVSFLGERKDKKTYAIDSSGALAIDLLPPFAAAGQTLGELRDTVRHMLDMQSFHGDVYISLERMRQLSVLVAGHVARPGRQTVGALETVSDALEAAGGVLKTGSLRQIRLVRAGASTPIDLYDVIREGTDTVSSGNNLLRLRDGDRIIVPPMGPSFAVTGDVRAAGIYELPLSGEITGADALALSGGLIASGQNRITLLAPNKKGERVAEPMSDTSTRRLTDGAVISVVRTQDRAAASFTLAGETRSAGTYPIAQYRKLSALLRRPEAFGDDVYPLMGVISRRLRTELARDYIAFSPQDIFMGRADATLQDGDVVTLLSRAVVRDLLNPDRPEAATAEGDAADQLLASFVREHAVSLKGAVRLPGLWPVAGPVAAARLLDVAGGPLRDADTTRTEISRNDVGLPATTEGVVAHRESVDLSQAGSEMVTVSAGDALRIPDRFEAVTRQSVTVLGEVRNPGTYDLMRGDTLLTLIDRAGGLTDQGYSAGTVFSRASERRREKERFSAAARDLERALAVSAKETDASFDNAQLAMAQGLIAEMRAADPVGRITVEADPAILRRDPAQDILLESDDRIYIPKRPLTVRVIGEVLSPAALQFKADKDVKDYLSEAGGFTLNADKSRIFVLKPDGAAQPVAASNWTRFRPVMITPGSTIVVPHDPKPFDFIESAKDITQILSNLAVSSIYAEDLVDRN